MAARKEMPPLVETDMFATVQPQARAKSPFYPVSHTPAAAKSFAPPITLMSGFSKSQAKTDAIYILRGLANQAWKKTPIDKSAFLAQVKREIGLKEGQFEAETLARDSLLQRFVPKS